MAGSARCSLDDAGAGLTQACHDQLCSIDRYADRDGPFRRAVVLLRRGLRKQPILMLILAVVMLGNVVIWSIPTKGGQSLVETQAPR